MCLKKTGKKKKKAQCESCEQFYLGQNQSCSLGNSNSNISERLPEGGEERSQDTEEFCNKRGVVKIVIRLLLVKENQMSQVKQFSAFLCMGRCKSLGPLNSFFYIHLTNLGSISLLSHPEFPQDSQQRAASNILFLPAFPQSTPAHVEGLQTLMTVASFVYCYGRKMFHFSGFRYLPSSCVLTWPFPGALHQIERGSNPCDVYFYKGTNSIMRAPL